MKICAIICEYNPFHNGHAYHLKKAREQTQADYVLAIMSGNFVQRGEAAMLSKYERAKHAVIAGADAVIELPTVFAVSDAELFAKGGVKLAAAAGATALSFGAENGDKNAFFSAAKKLLNEPKEVSEQIKTALDKGESYPRARAAAWQGSIASEFLEKPNNILGLEYAKAVLSQEFDIELCPILRKGVEHDDEQTGGCFASAKKIRGLLFSGNTKQAEAFLPSFVFKDVKERMPIELEAIERFALISKTEEEISRACDCGEGLEHALKKHVRLGTDDIAGALTSKRHTRARIKRIMLQNTLGIEKELVLSALREKPYLRILAAKKTASPLFSELSKNNTILVRASDGNNLTGIAKQCFEKDEYAEAVYAAAGGKLGAKKIFL